MGLESINAGEKGSDPYFLHWQSQLLNANCCETPPQKLNFIYYVPLLDCTQIRMSYFNWFIMIHEYVDTRYKKQLPFLLFLNPYISTHYSSSSISSLPFPPFTDTRMSCLSLFTGWNLMLC